MQYLVSWVDRYSEEPCAKFLPYVLDESEKTLLELFCAEYGAGVRFTSFEPRTLHRFRVEHEAESGVLLAECSVEQAAAPPPSTQVGG